MIKRILSTVLVLAMPLLGQSVMIDSKVSTGELFLNQRLSYQVSVKGEDVPKITQLSVPTFDGMFRVLGRSQHQNTVILNGRRSLEVVYTFTLQPLEAGRFELPPSSVQFQGETFSTGVLAVTVKPVPKAASAPVATPVTSVAPKAAASPAAKPADARASQPIFLKAETNKKTVYVGEPFTYTATMFRRVRLLRDPNFEAPKIQDVLINALPRVKGQQVQQVSGIDFYAENLAKLQYTPLIDGELRISPSRMGVVLSRFEGQRILSSEPLTVRVKPLPEKGRPQGFSGVVGEFGFEALSTVSAVVTQNVPLTLKIAVSGPGAQQLDDLYVPDTKAFRIYKAGVEDVDAVKPAKRIFDYVVIPVQAGEHALPAISFSYFSPQKKRYLSKKSPGQVLTVMPDGSEAAPVAAEPSEPVNVGLQYVLSDKALMQDSAVLFNTLLWVVALIALGQLGYLGYLTYNGLLSKTQGAKLAEKKAVASLLHLSEQAFSPEVVNQCHNALLSFLSMKTGQDCNGIRHELLLRLLQEKGLSEKASQAVIQLLEKMASYAYSPEGANKQKLQGAFKQAVQALSKWEVAP